MPKGMDGRLLRRRMAPLVACLLVALATAGCGDSGDSDSAGTVASRARRVVQVQRAKQDRWTYARLVFNEMCAGCHRLADAGASGRRFDLDSAGRLDERHVRSTISHGASGMPRFRDVLAEREYEEVVTYLVALSRNETSRRESPSWTAEDTEKLEDYARRLVKQRFPRERGASDG
jgi:mono/diheme cytochrome c family protein